MTNTMQAAIVEAPRDLRVRQISRPLPGDYDVLCEILYGAICSGTDTHIVDNEGLFSTVVYPTILGHESIGRVVEIGSKVRNLRQGDLVTRVGCPAQDGLTSTWGGFAEFGLGADWRAMQADGLPVKASHTRNELLPADLDPAAATMFITWRETLSYITRMGIAAGANLLVIGSGGNGLAFAVHARNTGAKVTVIGAANRREALLAAGAEHYFDYRAENLVEGLKAAAPAGYDMVIDAVGRVGGLDLGLQCLRPGGKLGLYGVDDFQRITINPMYARGSFTFFNDGYDEQETHQAVIDLVRQGKLDASLWLDLENPVPLQHIERAFDAIRNRSSVKGLIRIRG